MAFFHHRSLTALSNLPSSSVAGPWSPSLRRGHHPRVLAAAGRLLPALTVSRDEVVEAVGGFSSFGEADLQGLQAS